MYVVRVLGALQTQDVVLIRVPSQPHPVPHTPHNTVKPMVNPKKPTPALHSLALFLLVDVVLVVLVVVYAAVVALAIVALPVTIGAFSLACSRRRGGGGPSGLFVVVVDVYTTVWRE